MAPADAPSPTPSTTQPKRARAGAGGGARHKRRKPETATPGPESGAEKERRPVSFGVGMVKGREEEWSEPADVKTKINFLDLPVEALYDYLIAHDLLPRWDVSPWSEEPCTPPNALYAIPPPPPVVPINPPSPKKADAALDPTPAEPDAASRPAPGTAQDNSAGVTSEAGGAASAGAEGAPPTDPATSEAAEGGDDENMAAPTTRSKTAPFRRPSTPSPSPAPEIKRGVMTLSDVYAARAVLAEKANQHWAKGLGGGQNRESETIVNFLYKNKVGHNRLLRVFNPVPAPFV